ncbi:hypothetical protein F4677DRAFT_432719 [Hypoxylon crocopeplum]|nr:hypothetical protein F4677DRAFT_432719 [Hypoxylon crocopeplum]
MPRVDRCGKSPAKSPSSYGKMSEATTAERITPAKSTRRKACAACTKAKRPCSKRLPCCDRCERKNVPCRYPPVHQTARDYAVSDSALAAATGEDAVHAEAALPIHVFSFEPFYPDVDSCAQDGGVYHPCSTGLARKTKTLPLGYDWFYSSDSWMIAHSSTPAFPSESFDTTALKNHVATVQGWLRQWATTGRSPFIHHRLYSQKMPHCVQDAYTTLSAYLGRTPENSDLCFRIIREQAAGIVEEAQRATPIPIAASAAADGQTELIGGTVLLDPLDHLARVHALFVYQMIGLFDGDITLRATAESHMSTLMGWVEEMWHSAEFDASIYSTMVALEKDACNRENGSTAVAGNETTTWRRWIVLESIRRAWLLVVITQSIYQLFKDGWTQCAGSVNWTTRAGLWDAPDQYSWSKLVMGGPGPLFVPSLRADLLYKEATPAEVNEFGHAILIAEFGLEKMAKWKADTV